MYTGAYVRASYISLVGLYNNNINITQQQQQLFQFGHCVIKSLRCRIHMNLHRHTDTDICTTLLEQIHITHIHTHMHTHTWKNNQLSFCIFNDY